MAGLLLLAGIFQVHYFCRNFFWAQVPCKNFVTTFFFFFFFWGGGGQLYWPQYDCLENPGTGFKQIVFLSFPESFCFTVKIILRSKHNKVSGTFKRLMPN